MAPPVGNDIFAGRCTCGLVDGDVERYKSVRLKSAVGDITAKDMLNVRQAEIEAGGDG